MKNLFIPDKIKEEKIEDLVLKEDNLQEKIMLFSSKHEIFILEDFNKGPRWFRSRLKNINSLCLHKGKIYDAGHEGVVYDTITEEPVVEREDWIWCLAKHNGRMYDCGNYNKVYDTLNEGLVVDREKWVYSLCSYRNRLYDSGYSFKILDSFDGSELLNTTYLINAMYSYDGMLFYGGNNKEICAEGTNHVFGKREETIRGFVEWDDLLYDYGNYKGIFSTKEDKQVFEWRDLISSVITIPKIYVKEYL